MVPQSTLRQLTLGLCTSLTIAFLLLQCALYRSILEKCGEGGNGGGGGGGEGEGGEGEEGEQETPLVTKPDRKPSVELFVDVQKLEVFYA